MKKDQIILSKATPHKSAELFREQVYPTLINVAEDWLTYDERGPYLMIDNDAMTARIRRFLISAKVVTATEVSDGRTITSTGNFNPKKNDVAEVYAALHDLCYLPLEDNTPPCWLTKDYSDLEPRNLIACRNGLLDMTTLILHAHSPQFFTRSALPIDFDADAPEPTRFLQFLYEITAGRAPLIELIQEMMGYYLTTDTEFEVVFYLIGKSRGGKGTLIKIIKALVGDRNIAAPTIRSFASQYWAWPLMDKTLAIVTDVAITDREAVKLAANHINMVSGRDPVLVERKYKAPIMNYTLPSRVLMAGNFLPDFGEHAEALLNRLIAIPFDVSFAGRADKSLARRMIADELPGILLWSLKGLARLMARGKFNEPRESLDKKGVLRNLANPTLSFVDQCCVTGAEHIVTKSTLYSAYRTWCEQQGIGALALKDFAQRLYETVEGSDESRPRVDGEQVRSFTGLTLKDYAAAGIVPDTLAAIDEYLDLGVPPGEAIEYVRMARERDL